MNLDDPASFGAVDTRGAFRDVEETPQQWEQARKRAATTFDARDFDAVVVAGMGGSGIAGDVVAALARPRLPVPVIPHKGYGLPAFAGPHTLVLAVSASGNTEETLSATEEARRRGSTLYAVTGSGRLAADADRDGFPTCAVPGGAAPRHLLGALAVPLLMALGLDDELDDAIGEQQAVLERCGREVPTTANRAKQLGTALASGRPIVLWGTQGLGSVAAYRLKCQLNENAKLPAFSSELPELDHNEVVGWQEPPSAEMGGLVVFRDPAGEHPRVAARVAPSVRIARRHMPWVEELESTGASATARLASLILLADLVSLYAALARDLDPTPIAAIDSLKAQLAGK